MFFLILQRVILSFVFIAIIHYIYIFFKDNLTIPKVKDLVNKPTQQYDEIYKSMGTPPREEKSSDKDIMKAELVTYLKELSARPSGPEASGLPKAAEAMGSLASTYQHISR